MQRVATAALLATSISLGAVVMSASTAVAEAIELTLYRTRVSGAKPDRPTGIAPESFVAVRERRTLALAAGINRVRIEPLPSTTIPSTIWLSDASDPKGFRVRSLRLVGQSSPATAGTGPVTIELDRGGELTGIVIERRAHHLLVRSGDKLQLIPRARIESIREGDGAGALEVEVEVDRAGKREIDLRYRATDLSWEVAYTAVRDGSAVELSATLELDNKTGMRFGKAKVHLVDREIIWAPKGRSYESVAIHPVADRWSTAAGEHPIPEGKSERPLLTLGKLGSSPVQIYEPRPGRTAPSRFPQTSCSTYAQPPTSVQASSAVELRPGTAAIARLMPGSVRYLDRVSASEMRPLATGKLEIDRANGAVRLRTGTNRLLGSRRSVANCEVDMRGRQLTETIEVEVTSEATEPIDAIVRLNMDRWSSFVITAESTKGSPFRGGRSYRLGLMPRASKTIRYTVVYHW